MYFVGCVSHHILRTLDKVGMRGVARFLWSAVETCGWLGISAGLLTMLHLVWVTPHLLQSAAALRAGSGYGLTVASWASAASAEACPSWTHGDRPRSNRIEPLCVRLATVVVGERGACVLHSVKPAPSTLEQGGGVRLISLRGVVVQKSGRSQQDWDCLELHSVPKPLVQYMGALFWTCLSHVVVIVCYARSFV